MTQRYCNKIIFMKMIKNIVIAFLLLLVICTSNFCSHKMAYNKNEFGYTLINNSEIYNLSNSTTTLENHNTALLTSKSEPVTWQVLKDVTYVVKYNKQFRMDYKYPVFGKNVKSIEGKELFIKGYVIPLDVSQGYYALSRFPYSSCYFCGKSGPESVISLKFAVKPKKIKLDAIKTMQGVMYLNDSDPMDFIYIFKETEIYSP